MRDWKFVPVNSKMEMTVADLAEAAIDKQIVFDLLFVFLILRTRLLP